MADSKVSDLTDGSRPDFDDYIYGTDSGSSFKHSMEDVASYVQGTHFVRRHAVMEDFLNTVASSLASGGGPFFGTFANTAATAGASIASASHPGVIAQTTGSTSIGRSNVTTSLSAYDLSSGPTEIEVCLNVGPSSTGSNSVDRYAVFAGFYDTLTGITQSNGVGFLYDNAGTSTGSATSNNWQTLSCSGGTRVYTTTSTTAATDRYQRLTATISTSARVDFYIDGTWAASHTSGVPTSSRRVCAGIGIMKTVGGTARTVNVDYIRVEQDFTTAR